MSDPTTPTLGHNNPPEPITPEAIQERLARDNAQLLTRMADLGKRADEAPAKLDTEEENSVAQDLFKEMRKAKSDADGAFKIEKEPFDLAVKAVKAFFAKPTDVLVAKQATLKSKIDDFLERKKAKAAAEAAAKAARERQEAADRLRAAQEAEARRVAAERAEAEARAAAERARIEKEAAEAAAAKARARARKLQKLEPYLRKRSAREAARLADREAARQAEEADRLAREAAKKKAQDEAAAETAKAAQLRKDTKAHERTADSAERAQGDAAKEAQVEMVLSDKLEQRAGRTERRMGSAADLSRSRGDLGSVGSLARRWTADVTDFELLIQGGDDLDEAVRLGKLITLLNFVHRDAVSAAVNKAMTAGVRDLPGVHYEQVEEGRIV